MPRQVRLAQSVCRRVCSTVTLPLKEAENRLMVRLTLHFCEISARLPIMRCVRVRVSVVREPAPSIFDYFSLACKHTNQFNISDDILFLKTFQFKYM